MIAVFEPCTLRGTVRAPSSKSMAHRYLIGAALSGEVCTLSGIDFGEDILATVDCLRALGARVTVCGDEVTVDPKGFMEAEAPVLDCRESGSTLRFFLPLALCLGRPVTLRGSRRLMERPLSVYEDLCREQGCAFRKEADRVEVCGDLKSGTYALRGHISSQFITGMLFALVWRGGEGALRILPPFESRPYVELTVSALRAFGADVAFADPDTVRIGPSLLHGWSGRIEGDWSNGAFLDACNMLGSQIQVEGLDPGSLQGDRVYRDLFRQLSEGMPTLDISDCPDLGPVLFALAALKNGAVFTGTERLKLKESDRGRAMDEELRKLGGGLIFGDGTVTVPKQALRYRGIPLSGHNDHRIVMALSVILSVTGGELHGAEAVAKSYPRFFDDLKSLGAKLSIEDGY